MAKCMMHGSEVYIQILVLSHNVILSKLSFLNLFYYLENEVKTDLQGGCDNLIILNPLVLEITLRFDKYYFSFPHFVFFVKLFQPQVRTRSLIADAQ